MALGDAYVFRGFLTPVLTQLLFPKPPTTFLTCFCRGERPKYAGKKSRLNRRSNLQPPGHESDTLTTEPPGQGVSVKQRYFLYACVARIFHTETIMDTHAWSATTQSCRTQPVSNSLVSNSYTSG